MVTMVGSLGVSGQLAAARRQYGPKMCFRLVYLVTFLCLWSFRFHAKCESDHTILSLVNSIVTSCPITQLALTVGRGVSETFQNCLGLFWLHNIRVRPSYVARQYDMCLSWRYHGPFPKHREGWFVVICRFVRCWTTIRWQGGFRIILVAVDRTRGFLATMISPTTAHEARMKQQPIFTNGSISA